MSAYYETQWSPAATQGGWDHQTPPPARSGASSAIPREEPTAFLHQFEEVDRAVDNLVKSGKMFGLPGAGRQARVGPGAGPRTHSVTDFGGDARGPAPHSASNLQGFYAAQRHQPSRGSNEAEQMMQVKRRMAAQRERELRNYHQEQQYNRSVLAEVNPYNKPDRTLSPGSMSEEDRRKLIAEQRSALYREGSFAESGGYVDETGASRPGLPGPQAGPATLRGHSPLTYDYGRAPSAHTEGVVAQPVTESGQGTQPGMANEPSRANSNSSPQSNPAGNKGIFDAPGAQQSSRTSASSPGGSPPRQGAPGSKPGQGTVAPIGTRPAVSNTTSNSALNKRSTTPLPSPLSQGYTMAGNDDAATPTGANPPSASAEGPSGVGISGWGGRPNGGWGGKSGLSVQASVWG